nr:MAG TPA: hypothetical protein [Caudoviricetes sp.]
MYHNLQCIARLNNYFLYANVFFSNHASTLSSITRNLLPILTEGKSFLLTRSYTELIPIIPECCAFNFSYNCLTVIYFIISSP